MNQGAVTKETVTAAFRRLMLVAVLVAVLVAALVAALVAVLVLYQYR